MTGSHAIVAAVCSLAMALPACIAQDNQLPRESQEAASLLAGLATPARLRECLQLTNWESPQTEAAGTKSDPKDGRIESARKDLARAREVIPALRKLIKPGVSVFDYPGLLAHGATTYDQDSRIYELYMGFYPRRFEGQEPYDFRVVFDATGKITAVQDVVHKQ